VGEPRYTLRDYEDPKKVKGTLNFPAEIIARNGKYHVYELLSMKRCPDCGAPLKLDEAEDRPACPKCRAPLWQTTRRCANGNGGYAKYPLARYIRDRYQRPLHSHRGRGSRMKAGIRQ